PNGSVQFVRAPSGCVHATSSNPGPGGCNHSSNSNTGVGANRPRTVSANMYMGLTRSMSTPSTPNSIAKATDTGEPKSTTPSTDGRPGETMSGTAGRSTSEPSG